MQPRKVFFMRAFALVIPCAILAACTNPPVPGSGSGVGFSSYQDYGSERAQSDAQLSGGVSPATYGVNPGAISTEPITAGAIPPTSAGPQTATATPPVDLNNPGISDEQDFSAVASRETIESDRQRIEANREAYQVIQPEALPARTGESGPSIVQYALSTQNQVGQQVYSRSSFRNGAKFNKNCAKYTSSDQAQEAFLKAGGPNRDRMGIDPDGDGFACYWDPTPFRRAVQN